MCLHFVKRLKRLFKKISDDLKRFEKIYEGDVKEILGDSDDV